jgi:signal peptidase II
MTKKQKIRIFAVIIPLIFLLDQGTKWLIVRYLPIGDSIPVINGFFDIVHTRNRGAAFGFLSQLPDPIRVPFFFVVSLLALFLITFYFLRLKDPRKAIYISLALILGGAFGNIMDRIRLGEVVDFLSFHWRDKMVNWTFAGWRIIFRVEWPAFNVADSAISVAVLWLLLLMSSSKRNEA